jgi:CMP-N-acetylneuraminic acid synthetase
MSKIFIHIGARKGSVSVKNKNIKMIAGKPLILWTINQAKKIKGVSKIIVNTDSLDILNLAKKEKVDLLLKRPKNISNSKSSKFLAWKFAFNYLGKKKLINSEDIFVDLDCTCPLRKIKDINLMIKKFNNYKDKKKKFDGIFTIIKAKKNPYFNLVEYNRRGYLELSKKNKVVINRRQDCPKVFEHVASIYIFKPSFLLKNDSLMSGRLFGHEVDEYTNLDIDSDFDFEIVEHFLKKKRYD